MNALEAGNIIFAYSTKEVIQDVSLQVKEKEFLGIIGPNGAGKSTLLRLLGRILKPKAGYIKVFDNEINKIKGKELAQHIGFVPQETHFALDFTVQDIVLMGRYPYLQHFQRENKMDMEAVETAIEYADIRDFKARPINALSLGERQRVVIARALAQRPKILLLDEPTSHLDLHHQHAIMELLKRLNIEGITIIMVQHDLNLASLYCHRLLLMHQGRIHSEGSPQSLVNEATLREVYKTDIKIISHPDKNLPQILFK